MKFPLHILHLEDNPNDAKRVRSTLEAGGIVCATTCVQTRDDFISALERGGIDLILSDFSLARFAGLLAAELVRTRWPGIPLIIVSRTQGEEEAIDSLKNGATDYVPKEHLARLVPAVHRALKEVEAVAKCRRLEAHLMEAQKVEAIGRISSSMAHDFNNILAVIVGYNDLVTSGLGQESPLREYTEEIRQASNRAAGLTRQLLVLGSKQSVQPSVIDPGDAAQQPNHATTGIGKGPSLGGTESVRIQDAAPAAGQSIQRILVVDDDSSVRQLNAEMLIRAGYEVDAVTDGAAGWKALQGKSYDLLITDNFMPKVTGIEMVKKLHAAGMKLPVIMATAMLPQQEFVSHPWLQTVTTLLKPFPAEGLLSTVKKILTTDDGVREPSQPLNES